MKSNLLVNKIQSIQGEYKVLLESLLANIENSLMLEGLDEIKLFWVRHIETVQLYLRTWFPGEKSFVFTASTYLDYDDNEHLPFLLLGDQHVLDDPLSRYVEIHGNLSGEKEIDFLTKEIAVTAKDNLKILENIGDDLLILPLQLLDKVKNKTSLYELGERVFLSLFREIDTIEDYFSKCGSIDEIIQNAREDIGSFLLFSQEDDISLSVKERYNAALTEMKSIVDVSKPDSLNFLMIVYGYLQQAINVIASCLEYGCIPYIRDPVSLHYVTFILMNMEQADYICSLCYKMNVASVVHQMCDKEKLAKVGLAVFLEKSHGLDYCTKILQCLDEHGINETNYYKSPIREIISDELEKLYVMLSDRA